jgi:chorismate mutase / prephenate dehydratase
MTDKRRELDDLRQEIGKLDLTVLASLERRAKLSRKIGDAKKALNQMTPPPDRAQMEAILAKAAGELPPDALREIFGEIFATCFSIEQPVSVAFSGLDGAFAHAAARTRFGHFAEYHACETIALALDEVTRQRASYAVVPYETQSDGLMQSTIAALTPSDLKIISCFETVVNLQLASKASSVAEIQKVYAIAKDRAHCQRFLAAELPGAQIVDVKSPAGAAQLAADEPNAAAFCHEAVALQHGLEVVRRNVRDEGDERVRYAIVADAPVQPVGQRPHRARGQRERLAGRAARGAEAVRRARREPHEDPVAPDAGRDVAVPLLHRGPGPPDRSQRGRRHRRGSPPVEVLQGPRVLRGDLAGRHRARRPLTPDVVGSRAR